MKTIDRLIIKAKRKNGIERLSNGIERLSNGVIFPSEAEPGKWLARGDLWNGISGSGIRSIYCGEYDSIDEAAEAINKLGEQYPNNKDVVILIEDVME